MIGPKAENGVDLSGYRELVEPLEAVLGEILYMQIENPDAAYHKMDKETFGSSLLLYLMVEKGIVVENEVNNTDVEVLVIDAMDRLIHKRPTPALQTGVS